MARGIGVGEPDTLGGESVDMRRLMEGASVASHIGPPEIIDQKEDDVWMARLLGLNRGGYKPNRDDEGNGEGECLYSCHVKTSGER